MEIVWLQAVIDLPVEGFEPASDFWAAVSATRRGDVHPGHPEFVHLVPAVGDMTLELQRGSQTLRLSLDLGRRASWQRIADPERCEFDPAPHQAARVWLPPAFSSASTSIERSICSSEASPTRGPWTVEAAAP